MVGVVFLVIVEFILIRAGMGFCFGDLTKFQDHFKFFDNPGWCFMYIGKRSFKFFEGGDSIQSLKDFIIFSSFVKTLLVSWMQ